MEKLRIQAARKYYLLSCHRCLTFVGHKENEESIVLTITNDGGSICFTFTDLTTKEVTSFDNPKSGEYVIPLNKGSKTELLIVTKTGDKFEPILEVISPHDILERG